METKGKKLNIYLLGMIMILLIPLLSNAQTVTYLNDKSKTYQLRSMENGKWEFHPGLYYMLVHKSYSGGYWKGLNIKWDVKKSSVGQIAAVRASEVDLESLSSNFLQNQIDSIHPLAKEETLRSAERMVDAIYNQYESKFKEIFEGIDEMTTIANNKSNGELLKDAIKIIDEKDLIQEEIDYIHEQGPNNQMEQAKRQLAYEEALMKLKNLHTRSSRLAYYAQTLYNLKNSKK